MKITGPFESITIGRIHIPLNGSLKATVLTECDIMGEEKPVVIPETLDELKERGYFDNKEDKFNRLFDVSDAEII